MRQIVVPHRVVWGGFGALVTLALILSALALWRVGSIAGDTCQLARANQTTLRNLIDVPRNAPGGPDAYFERQRAFYASIGFNAAETQLVLDAAAAERQRLLAQLNPPPAC